jgi:DNA mismatch repair protein MutS
MNPKEKNTLNQKESHYNSKKIKGNCEICGNVGVDIHHLAYQENADNDGFIGTFHMNHPANLCNLCSECHDKIHKENKKFRKTKTSNGFKLFAR